MEKVPEQFKKPKLGQFVKFICDTYTLDEEEVATKLISQFPELLIKERCANCEASMAMYIYTLDVLDALLLFGMGRIVFEKSKSIPFTEANKVHLQTQLNKYHSVPSRQTHCSKLGLIAKVKHKDGSHDSKAGWLITKRGFQFLAGNPVPKKVQVFRNIIIEHFEEMITIEEVLNKPNDKKYVAIEELSKYHKYNFNELETWAVAGFAQGKLL